MFWHMVGNKFLALLTNVLYNTTLSDMETCYKVFVDGLSSARPARRATSASSRRSPRRSCKQQLRIYEVPIAYYGRSYEEGKKITWRDGFPAVWTLLRYRVTN